MTWPSAPVSELCTRVTSGGTPKRSNPEYYVPDGIPWVKTQELNDHRLEGAAEHISPQAIQESSAKLLPEGTILVAMYGATAGKLGMLGRPMACNQACCALVVKPAVADPRFLFYALRNAREELKGLANGAAQQNLSARVIKSFRVPAPPLAVQQRVGGLLGALDDKIAVNERIATMAEQLVVALASGERWPEKVPLADICLLRKTQVAPRDIMDDVVDHYSLPAFDAARIPDRVSPRDVKSGKFSVTEPAVLLAKLNPEIPRVWNVEPDSRVSSLASTEFLVLAPRGRLTAHELWAVTRQQPFLDDLASKVTGTSKSHQRVRPAEVMATEVVDPRRFGPTGTRIQSLCRRAALARQESRSLAALRDTLLPQLMSGRLGLQDVEKTVEDAT